MPPLERVEIREADDGDGHVDVWPEPSPTGDYVEWVKAESFIDSVLETLEEDGDVRGAIFKLREAKGR